MVLVLAAAAATGSAQLPGIAGNHQQAYYGSYQDPYLTPYQVQYPQAYPGYYSAGQQEEYQGVQPLAYPAVQQTTYPQIHQSSFATSQPEVYAVNQEGGVPVVPAADLDYNFAPVTPVPIESQYQALDEYGQYSFGFTGGDLGRYETRDAYGNVQGSYNYIDSEGKLQTQHYVADEMGFRVIGTNLPKSPQVAATATDTTKVAAAPVVVTLAPRPQPVTDTPEVAAAKAAFVEAYNKAALAAAEAPDTR